MKDKVSKGEFAWYVVSGLIALFGLVLIILGIVERNMNIIPSKNFILQADEKVQNALHIFITFRGWGLIFLGLGVVMAVITLCVNARKTDREVDRQIRRQQRANTVSDVNSEVKQAVQIIEEPAPQEEKIEEK